MNADGYVPFHLPSIGEEEIAEVVATLRSGWLTTGPRTARFEKEFRSYVGARCSLAVNSCTAGLHLALAGLGIGPGDEVITTPLTFCSTVHSILRVGATPVLADIGPDGNIDPASIRERITGRTRALLPVHFAGLPCDLDAIGAIAEQHSLFVIEDAAHAAGSCYRGRPIGGSGTDLGWTSDAVVFSFYATKNLTTGEGGMITTGDESLLERMRTLCLHGITRDAWNRYSKRGNWFYDVVACGFKYNLSDIQSAIGVHQLRKLEEFIRIRTEQAQYYNSIFSDMEELEVPSDALHCRHAWHLYTLKLNLDKLAIDRAQFVEELQEKKIGTSVHFVPIPLHSYFSTVLPPSSYECPKALALYPRLVSLPLYPAMPKQDLEYVAACVKDAVFEYKKCKSMVMGAV